MEVNKTQALLYTFETLLNKRKITKNDVLNQITISDLTFRRYIQELRAYLLNFNEPYEIVYNRKNDEYYLEDITFK